jgi:hypothetical protein
VHVTAEVSIAAEVWDGHMRTHCSFAAATRELCCRRLRPRITSPPAAPPCARRRLQNVYYGMAGLFVMTEKKLDGGCGTEPW